MESSSRIEHEKLPNPNSIWSLLEKLGEGTYGTVYRAKYHDSNEYIAAKLIKLKSPNAGSDFENEFKILQKTSGEHENLPTFIGLFGDCDENHLHRLWFAMELCHLGPITRLLKPIHKGNKLSKSEHENLIAYAIQSALKALSYLHRSGIMHRDVKGSHILVTADYTIKLVDFGVAAIFTKEQSKRNSSVGTSLWMAPEVIACAHQLEYSFDERCDIWSLGITTIELADGEAPLSHLHPTKALLEIPRRSPPTLKDVTQWSENITNFISACLIKDYEHRPYAEQLLKEQDFVNFSDQISESYRNQLKNYYTKHSLTINVNFEKSVDSDSSVIVNDDSNSLAMNPWIENMRKPANLIDHENDLATVDYIDQQLLMDSLRKRFKRTLIYTFIGDVLLAINPKQSLPIDNLHFQLKYLKIRKDLLPHIFAVATNVYHQMMITRHPQCIILSGESGSGKTHAAQNLISEFALLGLDEQRALESRLVTMNLLLESFGNAETVLNKNSSRFGKLLDIFFSEYGTISYVQLSQFLLEKTRVVLANGNKRNFHIFYSIYSHFAKNENNPWVLNDQESFKLFRTITDYMYLGSNCDQTLSLVNLFQILKELNISDNEQSSILAILTAIIHLGNISFKSEADMNEPGCSINESTLSHANAVHRLLKIDKNQFIRSLCQSSFITHGETVTKLNTIVEAQQTRDAMAKSLYARLFDWIVYALNRYFRAELEYEPRPINNIPSQNETDEFKQQISIRLKANGQLNNSQQKNNLCSISILDLFGFETFEYNSYEQLCINIANEQLQYFFRQHTFAWELKEYEHEEIKQTTFSERMDFPNNRSILDMCLSKPIGLLALLDEESRFPQATDFTLVNKWYKNLNTPHFKITTPSLSLSRKSFQRDKQVSIDVEPIFTISHYAGNIQYCAKDFLEKNRDYVPLDIVDLLLQSDDNLVNLLFRSRLRKTGNVIYTEHEKASVTVRSSYSKSATNSRTLGTVSTYFRYSLMELVGIMAVAQPTFVRCLVPNRLPFTTWNMNHDNTSYFSHNFQFDSDQFDEHVVLEQIKYSGLVETIEIRRYGYSHRIVYEDFISMYGCLINSELNSTDNNDHKRMCESVLKKFHIRDYAMGKTKVFLKFKDIEQLNIAQKRYITKVICIQSHIRMYLSKKKVAILKKDLVDTKYEQSVLRVQSMMRNFLVRRAEKKISAATLTIQSYWRMWHERTHFKRNLLQHRNQCILASYFLKQIELYGNNIYQRLINIENTIEHPDQQMATNEIEESFPKTLNSTINVQLSVKSVSRSNSKQKLTILNNYYDSVHKSYINKKNQHDLENLQTNGVTVDKSAQPSSAISNVPQAPPCPPAEFFQQRNVSFAHTKRQTSLPISVTSPVDELKGIFAKRQVESISPVLSVRPRSSVSPPSKTLSPSTILIINHSDHTEKQNDYQPRRRLSSSPSIVKNKSSGLVTSSTSNLVGDMALTAENVTKLKAGLRKTGLVHSNQTLRRKLPTETVQVDFRSVLRPVKNNLNVTVNK